MVNSHNEWDQLKEVVVGKMYNVDYENSKEVEYFRHKSLSRSMFHHSTVFDNKKRDETLEDLEGFVDNLKAHGINVIRPDITDQIKIIQTLDWKVPQCHPLMSRDLSIIIGNEIIETSPMSHPRRFENDFYKEIFTRYFINGAKWTISPQSRLQQRNFDYTAAIEAGLLDKIPDNNFLELMFDGAQIIRLGADLIFNVSTANHELAFKWLKQHLDEEYLLHKVNFVDCHIDGVLLPLRPGLFLKHKSIYKKPLPRKFNTWDCIIYEPGDTYLIDEKKIISENSGMNLLSLNPNACFVQNIQKELIKSLEKNNIEAIPIQWRHGATLGGGLHCLTLDTIRDSKLESYFDGN
jgi:glycine amidinotransferase